MPDSAHTRGPRRLSQISDTYEPAEKHHARVLLTSAAQTFIMSSSPLFQFQSQQAAAMCATCSIPTSWQSSDSLSNIGADILQEAIVKMKETRDRHLAVGQELDPRYMCCSGHANEPQLILYKVRHLYLDFPIKNVENWKAVTDCHEIQSGFSAAYEISIHIWTLTLFRCLGFLPKWPNQSIHPLAILLSVQE